MLGAQGANRCRTVALALGPRLQEALESKGAETLVISDPYSTNGTANFARFSICGAAVSGVHQNVARALKVPVVVYGEQTAVPARVDAIVGELKRIFAA
jgi:hypothetical protein